MVLLTEPQPSIKHEKHFIVQIGPNSQETIVIKWTGFTKYNHLTALIIFIGYWFITSLIV